MELVIFMYIMCAIAALLIMVYDEHTNRRHDPKHAKIFLVVYTLMSAVWPAVLIAAFLIGIMQADKRS